MAGIAPNDRELAELIDELDTKSEEFPRIWRLHDVRSLSTGLKLFDHPKVGRMELNYEVFDVSGAQQRLVVYQAELGTPDYDAMLLLNMPGSPSVKAVSRVAALPADTLAPRTTLFWPTPSAAKVQSRSGLGPIISGLFESLKGSSALGEVGH